jgi:ABC-type uncharacterized transport system auxiliary subunit
VAAVKRAILALALVALLAGCGKQSYSSKLSAMCEDFAKREAKIGTPRSPAELAVRGDRIVADAGKQGDVQALRRLAVQNAQLNGQAGDIARQLGAKSCT